MITCLTIDSDQDAVAALMRRCRSLIPCKQSTVVKHVGGDPPFNPITSIQD